MCSIRQCLGKEKIKMKKEVVHLTKANKFLPICIILYKFANFVVEL